MTVPATLMCSAPALDNGVAGKPTLETLGLADDGVRRAWLVAQEVMESAFQARLGARGSARLGLYHEALWQWILSHAPRTRLLAHNVVLREGSQTRGELDLLFAPRLSHTASAPPAIHHAELAIKFFLGLDHGPGDRRDRGRWIGIGSFDSLAIKTHRLLHHQLPMGHSDPARAHLATLGQAFSSPVPPRPAPSLRQHIIMPGCLYHPWNRRLPLPEGSDETVMQGLWCHQSDWPELAAALPATVQIAILEKPHWLAIQSEPRLKFDTFEKQLATHFADHGSPLHCRLTLPDGASARLFVVKNGWPLMMPLTPRHLSARGGLSSGDAPSAR